MEDELTISGLHAFVGTWQGVGHGKYPTIESFDYQETLSFEPDAKCSLLHYQQRTKIVDPERPSHWESGFWQPLENGLVQISNAQNGGRVEVLQGKLVVEGGVTRLEASNALLGNDPMMVASRRVFEIEGDRMHYVVEMATTTTESPKLQIHLTASLTRLVPA